MGAGSGLSPVGHRSRRRCWERVEPAGLWNVAFRIPQLLTPLFPLLQCLCTFPIFQLSSCHAHRNRHVDINVQACEGPPPQHP